MKEIGALLFFFAIIFGGVAGMLLLAYWITPVGKRKLSESTIKQHSEPGAGPAHCNSHAAPSAALTGAPVAGGPACSNPDCFEGLIKVDTINQYGELVRRSFVPCPMCDIVQPWRGVPIPSDRDVASPEDRP